MHFPTASKYLDARFPASSETDLCGTSTQFDPKVTQLKDKNTECIAKKV